MIRPEFILLLAIYANVADSVIYQPFVLAQHFNQIHSLRVLLCRSVLASRFINNACLPAEGCTSVRRS